MWGLHDRLEEYITEESCKAEIESFSKHGQLVPALGRPVRDDPSYDAELVYGARRLFAAKHLNMPILVELREISDREAILAMDIENRHRKDISPYERAISYSRWLREGRFRSQEEMARALGISPSHVSRSLQLAKLPTVVVNAFGSPIDICEIWGLDLAKVCENPQERQGLVRQARALADVRGRLPPVEVYRRLVGVAVRGRRRVSQRCRDEVVRATDGAPLFRIRPQRKGVALLLPISAATGKCLERIRSAVVEILQVVADAPREPVKDAPEFREKVGNVGPKNWTASTGDTRSS